MLPSCPLQFARKSFSSFRLARRKMLPRLRILEATLKLCKTLELKYTGKNYTQWNAVTLKQYTQSNTVTLKQYKYWNIETVATVFLGTTRPSKKGRMTK